MDHLWPHSRVKAAETSLGSNSHRLLDEWPRAVDRHHRWPGDLGIKSISQGLLLHYRTANISPAIQGSASGSCGEASDDVARQIIRDALLNVRLVQVEGEEETASPQHLPYLHACIADHKTVETTRP